MADILDISLKSYNQIENGKVNISVNRIDNFSKLLKVSPEELTISDGNKVVNINYENRQSGESKNGIFYAETSDRLVKLLEQRSQRDHELIAQLQNQIFTILQNKL
jgi:transcriptional regulator with XRE-family HTH domain